MELKILHTFSIFYNFIEKIEKVILYKSLCFKYPNKNSGELT